MANRYWIGGTGNWNDIANWSASTGGAGGETVPGSSDTAYIDVNSTAATTTITFNAAASVVSLIITSLAHIVNLDLDNNITCSGTFQCDGLNATTGRTFIYGGTYGTAQTITAATVSTSNCDFRDITGAGVAGWDLSGDTGGSGDCFGNTDITFTTAVDWYYKGGGTQPWGEYIQWYTATNGGGSQMASTLAPLPQDSMYFDASSLTATSHIDMTMPRVGNIDTTATSGGGHSGVFDNVTAGQIALQFYGNNLTGDNMGWVTHNWATKNYFLARGAYTLGCGTMGMATWDMLSTNSITLVADTAVNGLRNTNGILLTSGTIDMDSYKFDSNRSSFNISGTAIRRLDMGSGGAWCQTTVDNADMWNAGTTTNLTFNSETSTIYIEDYTTLRADFIGGDLTYYNLVLEGGTSEVYIVGSNTFNTFTIEAPLTCYFEAGTTTTVSSFVAAGTSDDGIVINSLTEAAHTLTDTSGTNAVSYCDITYSEAGGGATWDATDNCTDSGNNSGWDFGGVVSSFSLTRSLMGVGK